MRRHRKRVAWATFPFLLLALALWRQNDLQKPVFTPLSGQIMLGLREVGNFYIMSLLRRGGSLAGLTFC